MDFLYHSYWTKDVILDTVFNDYYDETDINLLAYVDISFNDITGFCSINYSMLNNFYFYPPTKL
ncbi:hypothetical protein [Lentimicrobium sp. S6]|uniref:hypothetical protein n=1 Tax=Lentimicrobium sp. S6 TaxID=2735872 RepID=UPI00155823B3|nr:hypothetical protein [Lentimicrobium sp. S6]NPD47459.1 hypothetical protein [Lentimicrobium sp. S6]